MEPIAFGVCRLAVVPVRSDPREMAEQITQLLFGDHYEVMSATSDKKWLRIRIHADHIQRKPDGS